MKQNSAGSGKGHWFVGVCVWLRKLRARINGEAVESQSPGLPRFAATLGSLKRRVATLSGLRNSSALTTNVAFGNVGLYAATASWLENLDRYEPTIPFFRSYSEIFSRNSLNLNLGTL
jgi:hypothetical protein